MHRSLVTVEFGCSFYLLKLSVYNLSKLRESKYVSEEFKRRGDIQK